MNLGMNVELLTIKSFCQVRTFFNIKKKFIIMRIISQKKVLAKMVGRSQYQNEEKSFKIKKNNLV